MNFITRPKIPHSRPTFAPVWVFLLSLTVGISLSYAPPRDNYHISEAKKLSEVEAVQYLIDMQRSAIARSYVFRFKLKHYPYRARSFTKYGTLYGKVDPENGLQMERIIIEDRNPENPREFITLNDFLLIRASDALAWVHDPVAGQQLNNESLLEDPPVETPSTDCSNQEPHTKEPTIHAKALKGPDLLSPVLEGVSLSYFDLLVPYFYWREYEYLGPDQVKARPTQNFKLYNPDTDSELALVQLYLDDEFRAILKAAYLDANSEQLKSMELVSFKKTGGTYIPKTIDYRDSVEKGNKTRIDIIAAAMDVELPAQLFSTSNLGQDLPDFDPFVFDVF